ncbi:MAG TPA: AAA family ATPase [Steroidobacteraceae bacterium]|nr:AAA family ATPase [Steroidobacteraceae bacterium]
MILLPPRPPAPGFFEDPALQRLILQTRGFFSADEKARRQQKFEFPLFPTHLFNLTMRALVEYSSGKCAYCESPIEHPGNATLERFRPKGGALGLEGDFSTEHYWWLAFEWRNIYPACVFCNKVKGSKFPVGGARCRPRTPYEGLTDEPRLLVDPALDEPSEHLTFVRDGRVHANSRLGEATIAALELNRTELVTGRQAIARNALMLAGSSPVQAALYTWPQNWNTPFPVASKAEGANNELAALASIVDRSQPFAAAARAMVLEVLSGPSAKSSAPPSKAAAAMPPASAPPAAAPESAAARAPGAVAPKKAKGSPSALHSQTITRIEIKNFRGIADLDLPIDFSTGLGAPWTVLLGENGAGKSSILQALALTLLASDAAGPAVRPQQVLRKGAASGHVRVWFHATDIPRELHFRRSAHRFTRKGPRYNGTLLGYGATRLLPRHRMKQDESTVRLQNMFDPFHPLLDADRWLGKLEKRSFDFVARALRDVMDLPRHTTLRRVRSNKKAGVRLKQYGADLTLEDLSDGYQSVLGLTCDIIASLRALQPGALDASEAIVIIDELGAHLHPRWRMRIVDSLRRAFKRVQFIGSTHDPLCLRGLENGEAVVLRRTSRGRVFPVPDLPPVKGLRVDQLLTSEFFGLDSTLDPSIEAQYRELYRLLALRNPSDAVNERIAELREALAPYDMPGATRRERRLLQAIDKELAQIDVTPDLADREQIRSENDEIIQQLLKAPPNKVPA